MRLSAIHIRTCKPHRPSPAPRLPSVCLVDPCEQLLWSFAALTILPVALDMLPVQYSLTKEFPRIPHTHVDVVSGAAAAVAFIGELFMIKAMLAYDDKRGPREQQSRLDKVRRTERHANACSHCSPNDMFPCSSNRRPGRSDTTVCACDGRCLCVIVACLLQHRPVLASAVVVVLGLLLSITGFLLLMALEYMPDPPSR